MSFIYRRKSEVVALISSAVFSLLVYFFLSYLLVTQRVTIPVSILMFTLIFGLTKYYSKSYNDNEYIQPGISNPRESSQNDIDTKGEKQENDSTISTTLFSTIFAILIIICAFIPKANFSIFIPWSNIDGFGIIQLGAGIALSFFIPGYAVILIISKSYKISPVLRVLLAYLFSMLVTGLTAYIASSYLDFSTPGIKTSLVMIYLLILVAFVFRHPVNIIRFLANIEYASIFVINRKLWMPLKTNSSEILVFGSLLALLIISTYYLYGGITIGDQWFHQGRALLFMSGSFREATLHDADWIYPPFQSALLAAVTSLSGVPLVNTYASIAFLNITPVIAFYYFFSRWVPRNLYRASLLACSLFAVGSGFNWIYFLGPMAQPIFSQHSFLDTLYSIGTVTIVQPTNFIFAANPDFSTGLIYLALPAGFVLLGLVRERIESKFIYTTLVTAVSIIGILSHDEFYFFIIVGSFLPLLFKVNEKGNYVYLGFLFAFAFVYLLDLILPGKYYTSNEIFGLPLLLLSILLVLATWALFMIGQSLNKSLKRGSVFLNKLVSKLPKDNIRLRFLIGVLLIFGVTYMYGLSLITWAQLSIDDVKIQTAEYNVPWYFYTIKLGVAGILGLAFVLSYFFKRFEKEIFVFGLIIVIALFTGPYYDEHRFSKYVMVGMIGFASLLIYELLNLRYYNKGIVKAFLIPSVITCASISVLMFIGYNSLVLQTNDYSHNPKKNFPSSSEMHLFDILRNKIDINSKKYNIVSFPNEYRQGYLITRLQAFSGFPGYKLIQSPLTLNASTLDSFYRLLDYSDARYILIPKNSIRDGIGVSEPTRFALNYFPITYEDDSYVVLEVPPLRPPSSALAPEVALIYEKRGGILSSEVLDKKLLHYSNETFNLKEKTQFVNIQKGNQTEKTILYGNKRDEGITIWSKDFKSGEDINYIEVRFRILSENENISNDGGLQWKEAGKQYYASLSRNGVTLSQKQLNDENATKIQFQNSKIEKKDGVWYTLKIESLVNSINLYVDDILKIQVPRPLSGENSSGISNVGISSFRNTAEFGPLEIGNIKTKYDNYYYPLNILALSKANYDTFMDSDSSALSKKVVILPFDPLDWNDIIFKGYLDYVHAGGRLVIIDPDNTFKGRFSKLFSVQSNTNQSVAFTNIFDHKNNHALLNISGVVRRVHLQYSPDENVIASYRDDANQTVAPFVIEKYFSGGGRIILVNAEGYFSKISQSPREYFLSFSNISSLLDLDSGRAMTTQSPTTPAKRFLGDLQLSGNITLRTSSLSLMNEIDNPSAIYAGEVSISNNNEKLNSVLKNVLMRDLKLVGQYEITINSTGTVSLPGMATQGSYFGMSIPNGFNMTVRFLPNGFSSAEMVNLNESSIKVNDIYKVNFYNIRAESLALKSVLVLLKSPEIKVNGLSTFKSANIDGLLPSSAFPLKIEGLLSAKLDFVDNYNQAYPSGTRTQYITYLQNLKFDGIIDPHDETLRLPGDISPRAKQQGLRLPLTDTLGSASNVFFLISLIAVTVIGAWIIWPKVKFIM